jgi:hypothetical protein
MYTHTHLREHPNLTFLHCCFLTVVYAIHIDIVGVFDLFEGQKINRF